MPAVAGQTPFLEPAGSPGPRSGRPRRAASWLIGVVLVFVFIAFTVVAGVAGRPPQRVPESGAEVYLAADGTRRILTGPRSTQVRWTAYQPGIRPLVDGPPSFVRAAVDNPEAQSAAWVVENEDDREGTHPHLMRLDRDGLRTWATTWPEEWAFNPGRLEIPAAPRAGQRETTTGTATNAEGSVTYSSELEVLDATAAGPGCLEFRRTDRVGDRPERRSSRTRCPDRGLVSLTLPVDAGPAGPTEATWSAVATWPAGVAPGDDADLTEVAGGPVTGLRADSITFERGGFVSLVPPAGSPQLIDDRLVVASQQTGNLVWADPSDEGPHYLPAAWVGVGGDIITSARCGEVIVVATSQRRLLAHDGEGRWLWTTEFEDVAGSPPVRSGDRLLVATKDGALHAVGCRDGAVAWTSSPVVSVQPPAVGPAGVLVAAEDGVLLLDPNTGATLWERSVPGTVTALTQAGDLALVGSDENVLFAFDARTGDSRATVTLPDGIEAMHLLGDTLVARATTRVIGFDAEWRVAWSIPFMGEASLADADHVVVATTQEVLVLDSAGNIVERKGQSLDARSATMYLTRTPDGYLASDAFGSIVRWRR